MALPAVALLTIFLLAVDTEPAPSLHGDPALVDLLRDAQATNRASLRSGTMTVRVEMTRPLDKSRVSMEADVEWIDDKTLMKYRIVDPSGSVTGIRDAPTDLRSAPWHWMLRSDRTLYVYEPSYPGSESESTLYISTEKNRKLSFYEIAPPESWFRCCPPYGREGRPWTEIIGPHPAFPTGNIASFEIGRAGEGLIKQVRHHKDGSRLETTFSMDVCGNVVDSQFKSEDSSSRHTVYRWRRTADGPCVLVNCTSEKSVRGDPRTIEFTYRLDVDRIDVKTPVNPSHFTRAGFERLLPKGYIREDYINKRSTRPGPDAPLTTKRLKDLAAPVRSRGYLKKP